MKISRETLHQLIENKLYKAGLKREHAAIVADVLVYADARGIHSHGAVRVEYYAERISKGGTNREPTFRIENTGPCTAILHADNTAGQVAAKMGMEHAIEIAKKNGVAVVGISRMGHSGAISYFVRQAAREGLIGLSICQSDPMVVPFGGADIYYGTNPLAFAAPGEGDDIITFDMATTVQAWGKVLDARSRNEPIPESWAVDKNGAPTHDPFAVNALLPAAGPKGYGLMMMIDILSGILLGLPFGRQVSSMYEDLHAGRNLGQLHLVINPAFFSSCELFRKHISQTMQELNSVKPAPGFKQVYYPGQDQDIKQKNADMNGIDIVDDIYQYLISDALYLKSYETKNPFAQ
ncbi:ureidoglycolate dehydrogenase [Salmonella enterica]|uniref:Ureidoglycolate dehydrogenase n=1 Tax=Salmonella enterica TaxID=28901 RepID=A0A7G9DDF4_SALER|nr:ureidoglycolate dehydrogenase [Salmonella enterica]MCW9085505.1 ureidoglycolate dehydrogenase [Salmonella enterica]QNL72085.1 ureidoglycolate dehydrogenase [Salmonella enterica]HCH9307273.1 ureidoglycolate dehydrogenase [Salmonella enterica]HCL7041179.1 ureidoglycolate dehydrogenase [Salmonella enterica]HCL7073456.1 ureidoglycolate dehydrogenase [Salmonella enterica]